MATGNVYDPVSEMGIHRERTARQRLAIKNAACDDAARNWRDHFRAVGWPRGTEPTLRRADEAVKRLRDA